MAGIYEQAFITIAASWSDSSDSGLIAPDRSRYKARRLRAHDVNIREEPPGFPNFYLESEHFPLLTRAWVFQERLLSRRTVHFGKDQVSCVFTLKIKLTVSSSKYNQPHSLSCSYQRDGVILWYGLYIFEEHLLTSYTR